MAAFKRYSAVSFSIWRSAKCALDFIYFESRALAYKKVDEYFFSFLYGKKISSIYSDSLPASEMNGAVILCNRYLLK